MNHLTLPTYSEAVATEITTLRKRLETLEQSLCVAPRKAKTSLPSWLNDSDLIAYEKNKAQRQSEATRFRIESACLSVLQGSSASLKDCAREHRVSRSTIKTAFRS